MSPLPRLPKAKLKRWHSHLGPLRAVPLPALSLILAVLVANALAWAAAGVVLRYHGRLISAAVLSYALGLRHALDADHISAIDLTTRRLVAAGRRPVAVGTFFSLGHSAVVLATCVAVAATAGALRARFDRLQRVGAVVGSSVSAAFLLLLCAANGWVLWRLVGRLRAVVREEQAGGSRRAGPCEETASSAGYAEGGEVDADGDAAVATGGGQMHQLEGAGFLGRVLRRVFKLVDRPWKMLPLGILFGLGFDTSSEIAILGIASIQAAEGTSMWVILIFPILFTGRCRTWPQKSSGSIRR